VLKLNKKTAMKPQMARSSWSSGHLELPYNNTPLCIDELHIIFPHWGYQSNFDDAISHVRFGFKRALAMGDYSRTCNNPSP
jgi:hypothetical protein